MRAVRAQAWLAFACLGLVACTGAHSAAFSKSMDAFCAVDPVSRLGLVAAALSPPGAKPVPVFSLIDGRLDALMQTMSDAGWTTQGAVAAIAIDPPQEPRAGVAVRMWQVAEEGREALQTMIKRGDECPPAQRD